jgi:hypothetical protein
MRNNTRWLRAIIPIALLLCSVLFFLVPTSVHADTAVGPTAPAWYFAEGRIGSGFKTFYTIGNPSGTVCKVKIDYAYTLDGSTLNQTKTVNYTVQPNSRYTVNANADVPVPTPATLSATISIDSATPTCTGIVAERPVQFADFHGNSSGTDVLGATDQSLSKTWNFADVPTHSAGESFLAVYNPGDNDAQVTATYYDANGTQVGTVVTQTAPAHSRTTFQPNNDINLPSHVSAVVTSDHNVLVERPSYFVSEYGVSGAADVVGAPVLSHDWYFAEGNTASGTQENLAIANLDSNLATVTIELRSLSGATQATPFTTTIQPKSQFIFNVNAHNTFSDATSEVATIVHSSGGKLVAQRQLFTTHNGPDGWQAQGVSDTLGASDLHNAYSFAEGFTSIRYDESLALYNPGEAQVITVTVNNMLNHSYTATVNVPAHSRDTINITQLVKDHLVNSGEDSRAYAISMSVIGSNFVAERSMYYHTPSPFEVQGSNSVVGYTD